MYHVIHEYILAYAFTNVIHGHVIARYIVEGTCVSCHP